MIYHKPTTPRFRIAERVCVSVNNRPIYNKQNHSSSCSLRSAGSTPPCVNRIKQPLASKGPSPVHASTPVRSGIQSPKPTINGSDAITRQNSAPGVYESRTHEGHYDVVKPTKVNWNRQAPHVGVKEKLDISVKARTSRDPARPGRTWSRLGSYSVNLAAKRVKAADGASSQAQGRKARRALVVTISSEYLDLTVEC
ncbi:hypothetical protein KPH14_007555 [Odynerus spinipes]|uniref:Uncharacterized protein n=1 Tax=Odynerus spinipes TaxID=1348599 RepID=A0AAD9VMH0_9HYME|nr:hypothetical protein KPH14_007555 [Odynerus spinipes]